MLESMKAEENNRDNRDNMENVQEEQDKKNPSLKKNGRVDDITNSVKVGEKCEEDENNSSLMGMEQLDESETIQDLDEEGLLEVKREICEVRKI